MHVCQHCSLCQTYYLALTWSTDLLLQAWERLEDLAASKAKAIAKAAEAAEEAWMESWSYAQSQQKVS